MPGVIRTRVGYCGGKKVDPTYYDLGDHSETIQIDFDPTKITFEQLLTAFWELHNPCQSSFSRQYMCAVFHHNQQQRAVAIKTRDQLATQLERAIETKILPVTKFYLAEDYHQKYQLRSAKELLKEFQAVYPDLASLLSSTAVTRVNCYLGGHGKLSQLKTEIDLFGLSDHGKQQLLESAARYLK